jgi:hypothetical protein
MDLHNNNIGVQIGSTTYKRDFFNNPNAILDKVVNAITTGATRMIVNNKIVRTGGN